MRASCGVRADNGSDRGGVVARLFWSRQQELAWLDHAVRLNLVFSMGAGRWARMGGLGQTSRFE